MYPNITYTCAHCNIALDKYTNRKIRMDKYGIFKTTTIYHTCPRCYKLYKVGREVIEPGSFPSWITKFTSREKVPRICAEDDLTVGLIGLLKEAKDDKEIL